MGGWRIWKVDGDDGEERIKVLFWSKIIPGCFFSTKNEWFLSEEGRTEKRKTMRAVLSQIEKRGESEVRCFWLHLLRGPFFPFILPLESLVFPPFFVLALFHTQTTWKRPEGLNHGERWRQEEVSKKYGKQQNRRWKQGRTVIFCFISSTCGQVGHHFSPISAQSPSFTLPFSFPGIFIPPLSPLAEVRNLPLSEIKRETERLQQASQSGSAAYSWEHIFSAGRSRICFMTRPHPEVHGHLDLMALD